METMVYPWIEGIVCYFLLFSVVMNVLPDHSYKKYVQYYMGVILILIILHPIFRILEVPETMKQYMEQWEKKETDRDFWEEKAKKIEEFWLKEEDS